MHQLPDEILLLLQSLRKQYIEHREYVRVRESVYTHASFASPGSIILVVGPTRVGKSRAVSTIHGRLSRKVADGSKPSVWIEAATPDRGRFSLKHFTLRALTELDHPIYREPCPDHPEQLRVPRRNATEPVLRLAAEKALAARKTRWIFVDEAHHIVETHQPEPARHYLDSLKSLGNSTGVVSVWTAGYPILRCGFVNPHLNGRIRIIHFQRYTTSPEDTDEFHAAIESLSHELPLKAGTSLLDFADALHTYTWGCVGSLMSWAESAVTQMVISGDTWLRQCHFEESRYELQLLGIRDEIETGERALQRINMRQVLAKDDPPQVTTRRPRGSAFQRSPKRDLVGRKT